MQIVRNFNYIRRIWRRRGGYENKFESIALPGGEGKDSDLLHDIMMLNGLEGNDYFEPFAGGAGAALNLFFSRIVKHLYLNDADQCIYSFWSAALSEPDLFSARIMNIPLTIEEWKRQHSICFDGGGHSVLDFGFAVFYLNRCNRSGILKGAGPIGGYSQSNKWRLDARFYREVLSQRMLRLKKFRRSIMLSNKDALDFLLDYDDEIKTKNAFASLDPPYYVNGRRLYLNFYQEGDHAKLASHLENRLDSNWVVSYDDSSVIRNLYGFCNMFSLPLKYSLQSKRKAEELLIVLRHLRVPRYLTPLE